MDVVKKVRQKCLTFSDTFSDPANLVLDPLMGNGGVLKIAKDLKRKAIGIDRDSDCVEMVKGRLAG